MTDSATNGTIPAPTRTAKGRFAVGNKLGGRKRGSRGKLGEAFLATYLQVFHKYGRAGLEKLAKEDPATFVRVGATILPKALEIDSAITIHNEFAVQIRDFREAYELIGAQPPMIEAQIEDETEPEEQPA